MVKISAKQRTSYQKVNNKLSTSNYTILVIYKSYRITKFSDQELARYRGGWILGDWIKKVQESNASQQHRMILYSAVRRKSQFFNKLKPCHFLSAA